jgi:epoxyqueuosine reductase
MTWNDELQQFLLSLEINVWGIADLTPFKQTLCTIPPNLLDPFTNAIVIGLPLDNPIINKLTDHPTPEYADHYRAINIKLDKLGEQISQWIQTHNFKAQLIPASYILDKEKYLPAISHKALARMAGLGWMGKSLLIITPQFGPRIRFASILTNLPLIVGKPIENKCGPCKKCTQSCPAHAIKNKNTESYYQTTDEAVDLTKCRELLLQFRQLPGVNATVCGICIKVCPYGKKK